MTMSSLRSFFRRTLGTGLSLVKAASEGVVRLFGEVRRVWLSQTQSQTCPEPVTDVQVQSREDATEESCVLEKRFSVVCSKCVLL